MNFPYNDALLNISGGDLSCIKDEKVCDYKTFGDKICYGAYFQ